MLNELMEIIEDRKRNPIPGSYTSQLFAEGEDAILKKVGEEAMEVILAGKGQGKGRLVEEVADLFYHTLILLASQDLSLADIEAELIRRHSQKKAQ
jgi:phosphoribosyl-ATP pyrophosphohydrolase